MRHFLFFILLLLCCGSTFGQREIMKSDKLRPQWLSKTPKPTNPSFMYVVVTGEGATLEGARAKCLERLADNQQLRNSVSVSMDRENESKVEQSFTNGRLDERVKEYYTVTVNIKGKEVKLSANRVDEYWELVMMGGTRQYVCRTLYMVGTSSAPVWFDDVTLTTKYGARGFFRSLIPGWGQMYKGSTVKGACILGSEILLVGGVIASENLRASYHKKMLEQPRFYQKYNTKSDNWENIRNVCIGAAAAFYVYNLIDAIVAPGARRAVGKSHPFVEVKPVAQNDFAGLGLCINF